MGNNFCSLNSRSCNYSIKLKDANENLTFYLTYFQSFTESIFTTVYNFPLIEIQPPKFIKWYKTFKSKETNPPKDFSESNTVYPVPLVECLFLPEFKNQKHIALPHFKTIEMIAKGAFGKVYKVKDINSQNSYAMKILQKSQVIEENAISQVKDELNIQKMCGHHQFIVKCLFAWQTRAQLFIVSDYKSGGELLDVLLRYGPLSEKIIQIYAAELAIAIDFLHHAGVIYRDLKPENILLDENGHICVTDFGLSKWLKLGSRTNTICGTINYIAPEILRNEPYSHAVDWWSLGVVLCRLLTNEYPVRNDNSVELPSFVELSAASKDLLKRLLEYDPGKRLRALYALKRIAFFKDFSFDDVVSPRVHPREMLEEYEPINEPFEQANLFENFHLENS